MFRSLVSRTSQRPSAMARSSPFFLAPNPVCRTVWQSWPIVVRVSFNSLGKHSSMRIFILRSVQEPVTLLLPAQRWLARGLRQEIVSGIRPAFRRLPGSPAKFERVHAFRGKLVLHYGLRGLGQSRFQSL